MSDDKIAEKGKWPSIENINKANSDFKITGLTADQLDSIKVGFVGQDYEITVTEENGKFTIIGKLKSEE